MSAHKRVQAPEELTVDTYSLGDVSVKTGTGKYRRYYRKRRVTMREYRMRNQRNIKIDPFDKESNQLTERKSERGNGGGI